MPSGTRPSWTPGGPRRRGRTRRPWTGAAVRLVGGQDRDERPVEQVGWVSGCWHRWSPVEGSAARRILHSIGSASVGPSLPTSRAPRRRPYPEGRAGVEQISRDSRVLYHAVGGVHHTVGGKGRSRRDVVTTPDVVLPIREAVFAAAVTPCRHHTGCSAPAPPRASSTRADHEPVELGRTSGSGLATDRSRRQRRISSWLRPGRLGSQPPQRRAGGDGLDPRGGRRGRSPVRLTPVRWTHNPLPMGMSRIRYMRSELACRYV